MRHPDPPGRTDVQEIRVNKLDISDNVTFTHPVQPDDSALIGRLRRLAKDLLELVRGKKYDVPVQLTGWEMTEHMYTCSSCPFPTLTPGLFTRWVPKPGHEDEPEGENGGGRDQIMVRGYDKFFDMNEAKWNMATCSGSLSQCTLLRPTRSLSKATTASSLCLLVAHGNRYNIDTLSGALEKSLDRPSVKGEGWFDRHMKHAGKIKTATVKALFDRTIATIIKLYDDSFEEHVLPYLKQLTGLHLNKCQGKFYILPNSKVGSFARDRRLVPTATVLFSTINKVQSFTSEVGKAGKWRGVVIEALSYEPPSSIASPNSSKRIEALEASESRTRRNSRLRLPTHLALRSSPKSSSGSRT
ncbi:hypothetical protein FRC12_024790 [Ceratobasidium sp. 428]|nr:hypothetical protein FRC12_024790 [Ceratobasidium sp. 428]